jgi:hypothetical protein
MVLIMANSQLRDRWLRWSLLVTLWSLSLFFLVALSLNIYDDFTPARPSSGLGDAPIDDIYSDERDCWESPNLFMNICGYCIGENGVYAHTREAAPVIVKSDPNCDPGGILYSGITVSVAGTED